MEKNTKTRSFAKKTALNPSTDAINLVINQYGYEQTTSEKELVYSRDYPLFRLHLITSGCAYFYVNNKEPILLKKNSIFLLSPSENIYYKTYSDDPAEIFWVAFSGSDAFNYVKGMGLNSTYYCVLPEKNAKKLKNYMKSNFYIFNQNFVSIVMLKNFCSIFEIISFDNNTGKTNFKQSKNGYIQKITAYCNNNFSDPTLSIKTLSSILFLNHDYVASLIKKHFGMTFKEYLTSLRIEKCYALLTDTNQSIKEIAFKVGYVDQYYFSKCFKKYNSISPSAYRKKNKQI